MATGGTNNQKIVVMTVNIGLEKRDGSKDPDESLKKKKETIKTKKDAIDKLLEAQKPSIVFLQESKQTDEIPPNYEYLFQDQASLLFDKTKLKFDMVDKSQFEDIKQKESKGDVTKELDEARFCVATVKSLQDENANLMCVSWHGPFHKTKEEKQKALEDMLSFVDAMCMKLNLPCVIGGDFNLSCEKVISYLKQSKFESKFLCSQCVTLPRRKNVIDFFVTSKSLEVTDVTAVAWNTIGENLDDYFDHDPIVGSLLENFIESVEDENSKDSDEDEDKKDSDEDEDKEDSSGDEDSHDSSVDYGWAQLTELLEKKF